ncbi:hypothetical protein [Nitrosospira sp. Nsp1]|uniref:hypothetical protein n=1 Tax=Nitrosospira sp. Nsp1 TaxID=136547 RepID=UPI002735EE76|nr:hypothetical protein [Nitrosospira sp. Nsp1]
MSERPNRSSRHMTTVSPARNTFKSAARPIRSALAPAHRVLKNAFASGPLQGVPLQVEVVVECNKRPFVAPICLSF